MIKDGNPAHSGPESAISRGYELRVLVLLGLAFGFAYFDRMALTFLAPFVQEDLGLSNEQVGWANSGLSLTWALGAYLIGRWSDLIGRRKPFLLVALVLFSVCSVLSGFAWSFESLLAARIVMGVAEGPFLPICLAIMAAASAPGRQALNAGVVQNVFGPIVGTSLASYALVRIATEYDWHAAFFIAGIPGLILALLIWRFVDEPAPPPAPARAPQAGEAARALSPWAMLKERNILVCSLVSVGAVGSIVVGSIFIPLYLDGPRGYDDLTWSNIMAVVGICPAVGAIVVATLSDRIGRKWPLVGFVFLMAIAPAALLWFEGPVWLLTTLMFISWMGLGTFPLFMGVIPNETVGRVRAATAMGLVVMIGELTGGVFGPPVAGRVADSFGLEFALYIQGALALFAGVAALLVVETNPRVLARRNGMEAAA
ncbi:MAG TPA: MFS transporter [Croceibacterium sp.]|nr:MFS transporter [Croceibacterium sp.]